MKRSVWIVTGCLLITVTAVSALLWQKNPVVENVPAPPVQTTVCPAEKPPVTAVAEIEPVSRTIAPTETAPNPETDTTSDVEAVLPEPKETSKPVFPRKAEPKEVPVSEEPQPGDTRVIDGETQINIPGFGWIKDEGGGAQGTTVGNPNDQLTGNKVGQMGGGIYAADMYENGNKIGIMGTGDVPPSASQSEPPPITCEVIDQTVP